MSLTDICRRAFFGILGTALIAMMVYLAFYSHLLYAAVRRALGLACLALVAAALAGTASADELAIRPASGAAGITIHDAGESLRGYCHRDAQGRLWFSAPGGASFELVASVDDPSIVNKGDGAFHAFDAAEVRATLSAVRYDLSRINADVFILPFPRAGALESAAGPGLILLAPGVLPLSREHQHAELVHELGHVVQYARMPDRDAARWGAYRALRGIADPAVYSAEAPHAFRPHEIFAEDFRALFGDPLANYSHSVENSRIVPPAQVFGLESFLAGLAAGPLPVALAPSANPVRGAVEFLRSGSSGAALDLFDVSGRRLATVMPSSVSGATVWRWDGVAGGQRFAGPVFARLRGEGDAARVTLLP